ncbi:MAG: tRNA pseudouridine(55) synthase TruB [Steroidobacteraceae bacterium]
MSDPGAPPDRRAISGILLLDKPEGLSSNAALQRVKRLLGARKAGHAGSLDPLASGMLPICLGEATKVAGDLTGHHKAYRFEIALGARTATGDREGAVVERQPVPALDRAAIERVLARFCGEQWQTPPMYSALKRAGQPLYRLARAGIEVERAPRRIAITRLEITRLEPAALTAETLALEAHCSKGTYIRVLAEDLARALGTVGHVSRLRRLWVAPFEKEPMQALEDIESRAGSGAMAPLIEPDRALVGLPPVGLSAAAARRLAYGQAVESPDPQLTGRVRCYDEQGRFLGLGEADGAGRVRPRRMFVLVAQGDQRVECRASKRQDHESF